MKRALVFAILALGGCSMMGSDETEIVAVADDPAPIVAETPAAPPADPVREEAPTPEPVAEPAHVPPAFTRLQCYMLESDASTEAVKITLTPEGGISGTHYGTVHDEENAYYTAFETILSDGERTGGDTVTFQGVTEVDGDTQYGEHKWVITARSVHQAPWPDVQYMAARCDEVDATVWPDVE